jgi:hypothetical protein
MVQVFLRVLSPGHSFSLEGMTRCIYLTCVGVCGHALASASERKDKFALILVTILVHIV